MPKKSPDSDNPLSPSHYRGRLPVEAKELTGECGFNIGNSLKYCARAGLKDPERTIEDLQKALVYIRFEKDRLSSHKHHHTLDLVSEFVSDQARENHPEWLFSTLLAVTQLMVPAELTEEYMQRLETAEGYLEEALASLAEAADQKLSEEEPE